MANQSLLGVDMAYIQKPRNKRKAQQLSAESFLSTTRPQEQGHLELTSNKP